MGSISSTENHQNLTQYETVALDSELNLSDGHPRQDLTEQQRQIVESLSDMWMQSFKHPASTIEREAAEAFFSLFGQKSHLDSHDEIVACYSSSVAMEIFARALSQQGSSIALLHPTFDNIPDILRGNRLNLVAIDEEDCHRQQALSEELLNKVDAVFLTTPNNPTGRYISAVLLDRIARQCAASDTILALDTCFRGFDIRTHYDHYAILRESGCRWVVIEDTGKLWPTLELRPAALLLTSLRVIDSPNPSPIDIVADRTQRHNLLLRDVDYGQCQGVEATESVRSLVKTSRGVRNPRIARGLSLSSSAMASR